MEAGGSTMTRYHVNFSGDVRNCSAIEKCPFGDLADEHFEDKEKALDYAEYVSKPDLMLDNFSGYEKESIHKILLQHKNEKAEKFEIYPHGFDETIIPVNPDEKFSVQELKEINETIIGYSRSLGPYYQMGLQPPVSDITCSKIVKKLKTIISDRIKEFQK